jgi:hypothetical protein
MRLGEVACKWTGVDRVDLVDGVERTGDAGYRMGGYATGPILRWAREASAWQMADGGVRSACHQAIISKHLNIGACRLDRMGKR